MYTGELSHLSCVDYVLQDPRLSGCTREEVLSVLATVGMYSRYCHIAICICTFISMYYTLRDVCVCSLLVYMCTISYCDMMCMVVGFTEDSKANPYNGVSTLSGGWRMKVGLHLLHSIYLTNKKQLYIGHNSDLYHMYTYVLLTVLNYICTYLLYIVYCVCIQLAMARAMLQRADILLLDEPTNHMDVINVAWVKNYLVCAYMYVYMHIHIKLLIALCSYVSYTNTYYLSVYI